MGGSRYIVAGVLVAAIVTSACLRRATEADFLKRGDTLVQQKDYSRAVLEFNNAIRLQPKDAVAHFRLGMAYLAAGNVTAGVPPILKATQLDPSYAPAQLKLAELMTTYSNDPVILKEAQERVENAGGGSLENADGQNVLAMADLGLGNSSAAAKRLEEMLQRLPGDLKTSINLAKVKVAAGDVDGAMEVLKKSAAKAPDSADHALVLGQFYMQHGRPLEAESLFRRALELDPKKGLALALLGQSLAERGRLNESEKQFRELSAMPDKEYKPAHAIFLFSHGRKDEAIREFEQLWKEDPEDRTARTRLVSAYALSGRLADVDRMLGEALRRNPKDIDALEGKSKVSLERGQTAEAAKALQLLLGFKPDSANAHYMMAEVYKADGSWQAQRQELERAIELDPSILPARLELARALLAVPDAPESLRLLDGAPAPQQKLVSWMAQRNWSLFAMRDYAGMRKGVAAGLAIRPTRDLQFQDALLTLNDGDAASARAAMERILKSNPDDIQVLEALATSYAARHDMAGAIERLRQAAAAFPPSAPRQVLFGNWLVRSGDAAGGRAAFEAARKTDSSLPSAQLALAELDIREKKWVAARAELTPLFASNDRQVRIQTNLMAGGLEASAGNPDSAIRHFRSVIELDGSHVVALQHLASLLADSGGPMDEALQMAQKAVELSPADPEVEDTLGWILFRKGMYPMALKHLEFASAPSSRWRHKLHLSMTYFRLGERQKAQSILAAALKQRPDLSAALSKSELAALGDTQSRF